MKLIELNPFIHQKYRILMIIFLLFGSLHATNANFFKFSYSQEKSTEENEKLPVQIRTKSSAKALAWSIGATVVIPALGIFLVHADDVNEDWKTYGGVAGIIGGPIIGPSIGHFYAGQWKTGFKRIGLRIGIGAGGCIGSLFMLMTTVESYEDYGKIMLSMIPAGVGILTLIGFGVYDIVTVPASVAKFREQERLRIKSGFDPQKRRYNISILFAL